ncbi:hypothetical protein N7493_011660 [Penicillium malachiteum]|uniref:Uncharacterized protein n=1 Tax=Penicillium malachiteum TaxID=1324776 RepID=A0AAD6HA79_9EURO|nr:hypothetical protein N7493_011660 [Penicillium malachiteum]
MNAVAYLGQLHRGGRGGVDRGVYYGPLRQPPGQEMVDDSPDEIRAEFALYREQMNAELARLREENAALGQRQEEYKDSLCLTFSLSLIDY